MHAHAKRLPMPCIFPHAGEQVLTGDLGGKSKCSEFTKAVCARLL